MRSDNHIKAIILAGSHDFGYDPVASRLPPALWPIAGKPVIEHLLISLADQGIKQATICSGGEIEQSRTFVPRKRQASPQAVAKWIALFLRSLAANGE